MKNGLIIWSIWAMIGTGILYAYEVTKAQEKAELRYDEFAEQYCAKMVDGRLVVMHQGKPITSDIFLRNGTTVKPDGTLITKEGQRSMLKDGTCVDAEGKVAPKR